MFQKYLHIERFGTDAVDGCRNFHETSILLNRKETQMKTTDKPELFLSVINANKGIIYKVANSYCKNSESRNDLVQEIIIQLWKSFVNYNDKYEHSTWVYRIALNVAISFYRKSKKEIATPLTDNIIALVIDDEPGELEENVQLLYQFINELDELNKALMLLYLDNKTHRC